MMSKAQLTALAATCGTAIACVSVVWLGFFAFFYMVQNATTVEKAEATETPPSNFVVVGQYKGCDVVRWDSDMLANYKFFLHCQTNPNGTRND
jgi:hypothetical protein